MQNPLTKKKPLEIPVDENMGEFSNDAFFVKKAEEAKEFLRQNPLPESFLKKNDLNETKS